MSGTVLGGKRAAETNKRKYGNDFYKELGSLGGKKGTTGGFAYGDNGSKFGKLGGKLSSRPRAIDPDGPLESSEMDVLIRLSVRALGTLRINGALGTDEEQKLHTTVWDLAGQDKWKEMFTDLGVGPSIQVAWVAVLGEEMHKRRELILEKGDIPEDEKQWYKDVKNLVRAFEIATGKKIK